MRVRPPVNAAAARSDPQAAGKAASIHGGYSRTMMPFRSIGTMVRFYGSMIFPENRYPLFGIKL
jgi:hypothetical protein